MNGSSPDKNVRELPNCLELIGRQQSTQMPTRYNPSNLQADGQQQEKTTPDATPVSQEWKTEATSHTDSPRIRHETTKEWCGG